ncbi:MAG: AMP-binding protein [Treponema sp.]|nr:AMP-binding protein [Treponema sp.]
MEQTLPKMFRKVAEQHPEIVAQYYHGPDGNFIPVTYKDAYQNSLDFGAGLLALGIKRGDRIGLISDNRKEWFQSDMGLMAIGAIDVPRGSDAMPVDLEYILSFVECDTVIVENATQVKKILALKAKLPLVKRFIIFDSISDIEINACKNEGIEVLTFSEILEKGKEYRIANINSIENELDKGKRDDIAGIIFTSGTTGTPKGVMLSHGNFLTQLDELPERIMLNVGDKALLVLPVWHVFERLCEYVIVIQAGSLCYSKPVASILLADFQKINPHLMPAVPRVFEAVYDGIYRKMRKTGGIVNALFNFFVNIAELHCRIDRKLFRKTARFGNDYITLWWPVLVLPWLILYPLKLLGGPLVFNKIRVLLGKNFRAGISGGGAYPKAIDEFFWAVGINVVEGYGLTETSPVISVRPIPAPIFGTVGSAIRGVNIRVVDDNGNSLPQGKKGVLQVQGETVMKGYYKRNDLTEKVISSDGWLDTGDIAILTVNNEIKLLGRKKDTIVLRGGENIEPLPIEQKLQESRYINTAVVVGSCNGEDMRYLSALILPNEEDVKAFAEENNISFNSYESLLKNDAVQKLFENEIASLVGPKNGFKIFERVARFTFITKPFEVGKELSAKQEIMRYRISEIYKTEIASMY